MPCWEEFARIRCPILVVRGGGMSTEEYDRMRRHPLVTAVEIPGGATTCTSTAPGSGGPPSRGSWPLRLPDLYRNLCWDLY
ncbi:hypothetical protein AB0C14_33360 [Microbispora hainanensis]|uniref:hypothetical protein n=1 Tax=Microbispora hainanensis TaxID=568844 RepID=UPI0033DD7BEF